MTSKSGALTLTTPLVLDPLFHLGLEVAQAIQTTEQNPNSLPSPLNSPSLHGVPDWKSDITMCPIVYVIRRGPLATMAFCAYPQLWKLSFKL